MPYEIADVLIIGSGASAGPFAWHLSKTPGIKIVCLEQGDWVGKPSHVGTDAGAQRERLASPQASRAGVKFNTNGYPFDHSHSYWEPVLGNQVGGASVHYAAVWARLHPSDFLARSLEDIADDWPIRYRDLEPYYDQIDEVVGVSGVPGNPAYPPKHAKLQPAPALGGPAQILSRGFDKLKWHWWPVERAVITVPHRGRKPCPTHCAACDKGCPREAKNSSDVVFWPEAIRNGAILRTRSNVREITVDNKGLADGALYTDADGHLHVQKAKIVVVACNGIGTPRLLLSSKSKLFPDGLANTSGMVGKCLMSHPTVGVSGTIDDKDIKIDQTAIGLVSDQFYENNRRHGFARSLWVLSTQLGPPISTALNEAPQSRAVVVPAALRSTQSGRPIAWGARHHIAFQERFRQTVGVAIFAEELPIETNRVELDSTITDEAGNPGVKLYFKRSENTDKTLAFGIERMREVFAAAGVTNVDAHMNTAAPGHYLGTARMGSDPRRSVVDGSNRAHDVKNLFVIDGSVFTTGGSLVPTASIQAIALRTADYIRANSKKLLL
jgi:choline dehydrogenase-like flavoprotein